MKKVLIFLLFLLLPFCLAHAEDLKERLEGRILLQVEDNGEAWYINPDNQKRFYLGSPADAFEVMREQGLGISNNDFDSFSGIAPERLAGKIILKVEDLGKAYYINPADFKMRYLGRPQDAFNIMREEGLGITNSDLDKIEIDETSAPLPVLGEAAQASEEDEAPEETADEEIPAEGIGEPDDTATTTDEIDQDLEDDTATSSEEAVIEDTEDVATSSCIWLAEYFINKNTFGAPQATSTIINNIDFDWERGGPEEIGRTDNFSARFTADCYFEEGNYEFQTKFDDAIRVYFDGVNFIQSWTDNNREKIINRERSIEEGNHEVKVEYYDAIGNAKIKVDWIKID